MLNSLLQMKMAFETGCMALCLWSSFILVGIFALCSSGVLVDLLRRWTRIGRIDKFIIVVGIAIAVMTGATKGNWNKVHEHTADTGISLIGVYTGLSNDVHTAGGVTTTNKVPMVMVAWTGTGIAASTPVQYRFADTNTWTEAVKISPYIYSLGSTNFMEFVVSSDLSEFRYWHVGVDTPAVVVTTSNIEVSSYSADGTGVDLVWTCADSRAAVFQIWRKPASGSTWELMQTTSAHSAHISGFFLDKDYHWRITSTFDDE